MESLLVAGMTICLPFESENYYGDCMKDRAVFRQFINKTYGEHPELFPQQMGEGFTLQGFSKSKKQEGFQMRRIKLAQGDIYQVRPSFMMPYLVGKTDEMEKALFLRKWNVPFEALAYVFGRNSMYWYRADLSLGRNSIVGTTVKDPERMPKDLVADEKHTRFQGKKAYIATTVAKECILGVGLAEDASTDAFTKAYGHFKEETLDLNPDYKVETVNTDGFESTRAAWKNLFPGVTLILCFLHAFLKICDRCRRYKELLCAVKDKVWGVYHAKTLPQFSQRIRRLREWATTLADSPVKEKLIDLCNKAPEFKKTFEYPDAYRTSNALDRLMNYQDRMLYCMQYFHGTWANALLYLRSMALIWNFHPYGKRARHEGLGASPFEELNGFQYHSNWLHNLLIAASLGGWRPKHKIR